MFVNQILTSFSSPWPATLLHCSHKRIVNNFNESVHRKEQHTSGINTIPQKNSDFNIDLETLKCEYTFATDVLIAIRYESPLVQGVPDVSGHDHFGTRHFGTFSIRYIVTPGHAQLRT